jgi:Amidohydrolase
LHGQGGGSKFAAVRRRLCQAACKRVLDALPKPEVMLPRAVGNVSWGIMRLNRTVERMPQLAQAKRPATVYLKRFYCDCIIESPEIVTDLVGAERVLFGTDCPSSMRDARPIEFIQNLAEVSPADRAAILGSNATRAFKL